MEKSEQLNEIYSKFTIKTEEQHQRHRSTDFTHSSEVSIAIFEQVKLGWVIPVPYEYNSYDTILFLTNICYKIFQKLNYDMHTQTATL